MAVEDKNLGFVGKTVAFAKARPILFTLGAFLLVGVGAALVGGGSSQGTYDVENVSRKDIVDIVDVTGKVKSPDKVDLGIESGGRVARINVEVGDEVYEGQTLVVTSNSDLWAQLEEAQANLAVEQLNLEEIQGTGTIEEETAFVDLRNTVQDAYISADDAIQNKLDEMFRGSTDTVTPRIGIVSDTGNIIDFDLTINEKLEISYERKRVVDSIEDIRSSINNIDRENILETTNDMENLLVDARDLLDELADIFASYESSYANVRAKIDAQRPSLFQARSLVSNALIDVRSAKQDYLEETTSLGTGGSELRTIQLQQQRVKAAEARVNAVRAEIAKTVATAPFSGIVTKVDTEVGEIIASNTPVVSMISNSEFEIEAFVPEADISRVEVGSEAEVTLDAYGSGELFEATVVFVDPAETVLEGVSTYRILLNFNEPDQRIRSGMTANVEIISGRAENVLAIPQRAVFDRGNQEFVSSHIAVLAG